MRICGLLLQMLYIVWCMYLCVLGTWVSPAKMAELVDIQFVGADFLVQGIVY